MKKKFLSLMMAAAMVATTSISAFANTKDYQVSTGKEAEANVTVTGDIQNTKGDVVPSTINVTIPTTANFSVTKDGNPVSPTITITSRSEEPVSVMAKSFIDPTENSGITVVGENDLRVEDRSKVALTLKGTKGSVVLKSDPGTKKNGLYKLDSDEEAEDDTVLGTVRQNAPVELKLEVKVKQGDTAYVAPGTPLTDDFTLVLKLKKEDKK